MHDGLESIGMQTLFRSETGNLTKSIRHPLEAGMFCVVEDHPVIEIRLLCEYLQEIKRFTIQDAHHPFGDGEVGHFGMNHGFVLRTRHFLHGDFNLDERAVSMLKQQPDAVLLA